MKPHLQERSKISTLPLDLQIFLKRYNEEPETEAQSDQQGKKRGRCSICGRQKNKFTPLHCDICNQFVCKEHSTTEIKCQRCEGYNFQHFDEDD